MPEISAKTYNTQKITEVEGIQFPDENLFRASDKEAAPYYKPWDGYGRYHCRFCLYETFVIAPDAKALSPATRQLYDLQCASA